MFIFFFFQAEDGIRDFCLSRGLGDVYKRQVQAHEAFMTSFTIAKDFSMLITSSKEGCKVWDPETLECTRTFKQEVQMNTVAISPLVYDKKEPRYHIIMGGGVPSREAARTLMGGFEIHLCNLLVEEELGTISGHFGPVNSLAFFVDGRGFVSGGEEGTVRIFRFDKSYFEDESFK
eukprot:TRINITY_DN830_c0_g1_i3.p1 TRINITY_DN830_c0_g1~~TRINITY_DN830_c0_g1_i3.p1  ORF type:complete len:176 (-),score=74.32 TRINITY_DN830_c0_g1_i3:24-551(-)